MAGSPDLALRLRSRRLLYLARVVAYGPPTLIALIAEVAGEDVAKTIQLAVEYAPAPPFRSGTPEEAGEAITGMVNAMFAEQMAVND